MAARDLQHAKEFAKKHKIHRAYGSYEELAQDPDIGGSRNVFYPNCLYTESQSGSGMLITRSTFIVPI